MKRALMTAAVLAALAAPASAQRSPDFATLDRGDGISHIGLDVAWVNLDPPLPAAPYDWVFHVELHGQYVLHSGLGFYLALPFAKSSGDPDEGEREGTAALGDFDVGGLYTISGPQLSLVFRLGLVIPTASEDDGDFSTNYWGQMFRLTDIAMVNPDAWYARLAFSPLYHASSLFLRLDLGVDIPFAEDNYRADPIGRLNLGAGFDFGVAALMLELDNIIDIDDDDEDPDGDDDVFSEVAVTARFMGETLQPYLSVGTPIDDGVRDVVDFFIAGGIQGVLH